ncbi:MAG: CZB domain-containing protein [Candidatus Thiothrix putei]|uniref:Chemoreceptor zinc-binding domain-containing protein n=2 Tax=Thiothrix TaxID=1030 RepID=A0A1H3X4G4_9GAMM|nr:CZB domain-containing protein [Thiothrix caldifontis]WGZ94603.1 MAG: CZB domain-containing protein [Candidatus Thiothrix putei]SDZ94295.1 Chemoreceptor zinc-binding domain-containing protein [Thiothrix caldifontis]
MEKKAFFLKRLNDHVQYLRQMKGRLDGSNHFEPTTCRMCSLGGWLYGEGQREANAYGESMVELFNALFVPHERFHLASDEALRCQLDGNEIGMRRAFTEMHQLSNTLVNLLLQMDGVSGKVKSQPISAEQA